MKSPSLAARAALAVLLALSCARALRAQELGRLFFTPQQRQDMDRRRDNNTQAATAVTAVDQITVNGQVLRSSGKSTTWINGAAQNDLRHGSDPARIDIRQTGDSASIPVRVGETLDRIRGEKSDGLEGGKIVVRHR